ncbi:MAG: hypothetical protein ACI8TX_000431 [Hyphomicrobiaceae bacterium]
MPTTENIFIVGSAAALVVAAVWRLVRNSRDTSNIAALDTPWTVTVILVVVGLFWLVGNELGHG